MTLEFHLFLDERVISSWRKSTPSSLWAYEPWRDIMTIYSIVCQSFLKTCNQACIYNLQVTADSIYWSQYLEPVRNRHLLTPPIEFYYGNRTLTIRIIEKTDIKIKYIVVWNDLWIPLEYFYCLVFKHCRYFFRKPKWQYTCLLWILDKSL